MASIHRGSRATRTSPSLDYIPTYTYLCIQYIHMYVHTRPAHKGRVGGVMYSLHAMPDSLALFFPSCRPPPFSGIG